MKTTGWPSPLLAPIGAAIFVSSITGIVGFRIGQESALPEPRPAFSRVPPPAPPPRASPSSAAACPTDVAGRPEAQIDTLAPAVGTPRPPRPPAPSVGGDRSPCRASCAAGSTPTRGPARTLPSALVPDDQAPAQVESAERCSQGTLAGAQILETGTWSVALSANSVQLCEQALAEGIVLDSNFSVGGPTPNQEKCLQSAALGECAFVAGSRSEFQPRAVELLGNAPGLTALYGPLLDGFGKSLAEERWDYLASLDLQGNETDTSRPLPHRVTELTAAFTREISADHLPLLFGPEDPQGKAREWVEQALLDGLYDRNRYWFASPETGSITFNGTVGTLVADDVQVITTSPIDASNVIWTTSTDPSAQAPLTPDGVDPLK